MIYTKKFKSPERGADQERNERKRLSFARMYGESTDSGLNMEEFRAKCSEIVENYGKSHENKQNDDVAPSRLSSSEYVDLVMNMHKKDKIDPNKAFKRLKKKDKYSLTDMDIDYIINGLD